MLFDSSISADNKKAILKTEEVREDNHDSPKRADFLQGPPQTLNSLVTKNSLKFLQALKIKCVPVQRPVDLGLI